MSLIYTRLDDREAEMGEGSWSLTNGLVVAVLFTIFSNHTEIFINMLWPMLQRFSAQDFGRIGRTVISKLILFVSVLFFQTIHGRKST